MRFSFRGRCKKDVTVSGGVSNLANTVVHDAIASEKIGAYAGGDTFWSGLWRPTEQSVMNDSDNYSTFNAPSRSQIWTRVMKLSEGDSWTYDYDAFKAWDKVHPTTRTSKSAVKATRSHVPPVTVRKTWKEVIK